jgi:hypothetical protein
MVDPDGKEPTNAQKELMNEIRESIIKLHMTATEQEEQIAINQLCLLMVSYLAIDGKANDQIGASFNGYSNVAQFLMAYGNTAQRSLVLDNKDYSVTDDEMAVIAVIRSGDMDRIDDLLNSGVIINSKSLGVLIYDNRIDIIKQLMGKENVDASKKDLLDYCDFLENVAEASYYKELEAIDAYFAISAEDEDMRTDPELRAAHDAQVEALKTKAKETRDKRIEQLQKNRTEIERLEDE